MKFIKTIVKLLFAPGAWFFALIRGDRFIIRKPGFIQFIGIPGSGKTMSAICLMYRSSQKGMYKDCKKYSTRDAGSKISKEISIEDLMTHKFKKSIIMIDESSLNGLDSRDWQHNFKGERKLVLKQFKLHRHYKNAFITTSQSANDNDSKIRDGIASQTWICHDKGKYISCRRAIIWYTFDNGNFIQCIDEPSRFERLIDPYLSFRVKKKKYGAMYDSWATIPEIDTLPYME